MEGAMAVRVPAAHTAEARAGAGRDAGEGGVAAAAALAPGGFLGLPAPFGEEDEDDVHRCGRCQAEFTALEEFVQHKLQKGCQRSPQEALPASQEVPAAAGPDAPITVAHIVVEAPDIVGGGHIREVIVGAEAEPGDGELAEAAGSSSQQGPGLARGCEPAPVRLLVNEDGRYVCVLCHKTFKTGSILKAHMTTHSSRKDHECKLCGACFRTKGSLIRHHRRHTDERPYKCAKCGKSFRESGALTRHLKSLTPCTEKIRFGMTKDGVSGKEEAPAGPSTSPVGTVPASSVTGESMDTSPVIHLVTDAKGTVIHEVHVQMQELPLGMKGLGPEPPGAEELGCAGEGGRENLLRQAMQNSGIVLERSASEPLPPAGPHPQPLGTPELPLLDVEQVDTVASEVSTVPRTHPCPQCSETFPSAATLEAHKRGHAVRQGLPQGLPAQEAPGGARARAPLPLWGLWEALQDHRARPRPPARALGRAALPLPRVRQALQDQERAAGALPHAPGGEAARVPVLQPRLPGEGLAGAPRAPPHGREALQVLQVRPRLRRARHAQPAPAHQRGLPAGGGGAAGGRRGPRCRRAIRGPAHRAGGVLLCGGRHAGVHY
ncbi:transcription factor E4F1 isoform X4 [Sorex araneus]|uniref:transcription factor E4F1 isoform X4 n=1 Tax=Sorex araneus TaxID=42254 RepID=UPI0024334E22|nr:transcription factor E4F1 isoform X4 [Sorex araneus]